MILLLNLFGIITIAVVMFLLMNLSEKEGVAKSTVKKEDEKLENENKIIAEVAEQITVNKSEVIKEDIVVK